MIVFGFLFFSVLFLLGVALIYGTYQRWPLLTDPPPHLTWMYSQSFIKRCFGQRVLILFTYAMGALTIACSLIGLWNGIAGK